jgi:hypothetical protein
MSQYPAWQRDEREYLDRLAGDVPFPELVRRMKDQATRKGWPKRSDTAILQRLRRTGQRGRARQGACLTSGGAAEILGCPPSRVGAWLKRQDVCAILQPRRVGHFFYIERQAWRQLALEMPQVLGGFSIDALYALLEDRDLAEYLAVQYPVTWGDKRIRCIETGRVYANCGEAAKQLHVHRSTISLSICQRRPVATLGLTFEALRRQPDRNAA